MFQVFLDVRKVYDSLDRGWCIETLRGYGMGQNTVSLIGHHWYNILFVLKARRFLGVVFGTGRRFTKGDPAFPMIFNIVVDAVMREVLEVVCGPQEARHRMSWVAGERNLVFYMDDGRIAGRYKIWVQDSLTVTVEMFQTLGLDTNL